MAAYSRKIDGNEAGLPVIHWFRILAVLAVIIAALAGVLALPAPGLWISAVAILLVVETAVTWAYRRRRTLPVESWAPVFVTPVVLVAALTGLSLLLSAYSGWLRFLVLDVAQLFTMVMEQAR